MRNILLVFFVLLSAGMFSQHSETKLNKEKAKKIDMLLGKYHQYDLFNGSALVVKNGEILLRKNYGKADIGWNIDAASDTKLELDP